MGGRQYATVAVVAAILVTPPAVARPAAATAAGTEWLSTALGGHAGDGASFAAVPSADGRYVAFTSTATNLVPGDTNHADDVFVRDRATGAIARVSLATGGGAGDGDSYLPAISADGRYVAFASTATNLVPGDANHAEDVFVRDRATGVTTRVSLAADGTEAEAGAGTPAISADGRYVAFVSTAPLVSDDTNATSDVFVRDRVTGTTGRISVSATGGPAGGGGNDPAISADGRYVAFTSPAADLVPGDTNGQQDVFVRDRATGRTERVSVARHGGSADDYSISPAISADGRYVAFASAATNLVPGDTNRVTDVFVRDRLTGRTERVSARPGSAPGGGASDRPTISADGRFVGFYSAATNLLPGDTNHVEDVFVRDRLTDRVERLSVTITGGQTDEPSGDPRLSADGRYLVFTSLATNLVPGDDNGDLDVYGRPR
ncbi:hypothetical protein [Micromonospora sp. NPDC049891]|uniref:hypothetical protein n=1 Tax=Micromonospora sp. NPDC049891 TaxID=3155655 RepID=UPI003400E30B